MDTAVLMPDGRTVWRDARDVAYNGDMTKARYYSAARVAQVLGVSRQWVWEMTRRGELASIEVDDGERGFRIYVATVIDQMARDRERSKDTT